MRLTIREAMLVFKRAPLLSALSIMTIAFSLFALGLFGLVALNVNRALNEVEEKVEIRAYLLDDTPVEAVSAAMGDIGSFPEVQRVDLVSQDSALARARRDMREFNDVFDAAFLPASLEVQLKPGFRDPTTVEAVAGRIRNYDFVEDVRFGQEWVRKLYDIRNVATAAGLILGVAFAAVAVIIIGATIRMAVLARAKEISIMRLVGATDGFIRRPFLLEGLLKGIAGGLIAFGLTWVAQGVVSGYLGIGTSFFAWRTAFLGVLFGGIIGVLGIALSVGRHLRRV
ncbi:MAG TPA: permease-like cell division protein FtsX [Gemmatimonadaceae bacterium]|nr:permease-like cell division protein FtsX [Gemmatimonadaceae bacterium]